MCQPYIESATTLSDMLLAVHGNSIAGCGSKKTKSNNATVMLNDRGCLIIVIFNMFLLEIVLTQKQWQGQP